MKPLQILKAALVAAAAVPFSALGGWAEEAAATVYLNVRSGPGPGFSVVDTLHPGEVVDMNECQPNGWCFITHSGPSGWVSSSYLTGAPSAGIPGAGCTFQLTIGPEGPRFSIVCGDEPAPPPDPSPAPWPVGNQACFYDLPDYAGDSFCRGVTVINTLPPAANDRISSVRVSGAARARLCVNTHLGGFCRVISGNEAQLGPLLNNRVSSLEVFTGALPPPPPPAPVTLSTGPIILSLGSRANLDTGVVGPMGADIWYRLVSPGNRRLVPVNGAQMARGDGSNRGLAGCRVASFSGAALPVAALSVGTYVCVRTSEGRISQFRVNERTPAMMRIGYTTWAN